MNETVAAVIGDPVVLPFSFTIPGLMPVVSRGMARLARPLVYPAKGWSEKA